MKRNKINKKIKATNIAVLFLISAIFLMPMIVDINSATPSQSGEVPTNNSVNIALTPDLYVLCIDDDDDNMNATWWSNSTDGVTWVQFASNSSASGFVNNTNITQQFTNATAYSTTYYWSLNLSNDTSWNNETYSFTTRSAPPARAVSDLASWIIPTMTSIIAVLLLLYIVKQFGELDVKKLIYIILVAFIVFACILALAPL